MATEFNKKILDIPFPKAKAWQTTNSYLYQRSNIRDEENLLNNFMGQSLSEDELHLIQNSIWKNWQGRFPRGHPAGPSYDNGGGRSSSPGEKKMKASPFSEEAMARRGEQNIYNTNLLENHIIAESLNPVADDRRQIMLRVYDCNNLFESARDKYRTGHGFRLRL